MTDFIDEHTVATVEQPSAGARDALLRMAPEKALACILNAEHPAALVQSLAEQDFHLMVNDIGLDDALPLLALATNGQWEHILDVEGWSGDQPVLHEIDRWLDHLFHADPVRLINWLATNKVKFFELYLYRTIEVFLRNHDEDPSTLPPGCVSLDDTHYYRIKTPADPETASLRDPDHYPALAQKLLERLAGRDFEQFIRVLLETMNVIPAELEEEAYRLRTVRLSEKGFLPFDEALGIYQPLPAAKGSSTVDNPSVVQFARPEPAAVPLLPTALSERGGVFSEALAHLPPDFDREALQIDFAALCNRIGVADNTVVKSRQDLDGIVSKATGYLDIALEHISGGTTVDPAAAAAMVAARPLADLFRIGYGTVLALKHRTERWLHDSWFQNAGLPLTFWGERWMGVLGGILIKRPRYFDNYRSGVIYREFAALADVSETRETLAAIMSMDALLSAIDLNRPDRALGVLTYKNLLLTSWARDRKTQRGPLRPLSEGEMRRFFSWLWNAPAPPFAIDDTRRQAFLDWLARRAVMPSEIVASRFGALLEALFAEIEEELGRVAVDDLQARYVTQLLLTGPPENRTPESGA